ncbi:TPA: hypothetical protein U2Q62_000573 [Citrobacter amalonaticus]|nr:hypothetical protein [Citrobacter amalonaticus]
MSKITNPVVLLHWHETPESACHIAITSGSTDFRDAVYMAVLGAGYTDDLMNNWSKTGYYMAAEIESLRQALTAAENNLMDSECHVAELISSKDRDNALIDTYDWHRQRLHAAAEKVIKWCRQEAEHRTGDPDKAENYACVKELRDALTFCESSGSIEKKGLAITLPDTSSKAFWSGTGKSEVFHPETYRRWVKDEIERACVIAGIGVEVK